MALNLENINKKISLLWVDRGLPLFTGLAVENIYDFITPEKSLFTIQTDQNETNQTENTTKNQETEFNLPIENTTISLPDNLTREIINESDLNEIQSQNY